MFDNVLRIGEGCLTDAQFSHKTKRHLLPNHVDGRDLSALNLYYENSRK
jgi:hypothetical protein